MRGSISHTRFTALPCICVATSSSTSIMCFVINNPSVVPGSENPRGTEVSENNDYHGPMRTAASSLDKSEATVAAHGPGAENDDCCLHQPPCELDYLIVF